MGNSQNKKTWIASGLILITAAAVLGCMALTFQSLDLTKLLDAAPGKLEDAIRHLIEYLGGKGDKLSFTGFGAIRSIFVKKTVPDRSSAEGYVYYILQGAAAIPYLIVLITALLALIRRKGGYIAGIVTAVLGEAFALLSVLVYLPRYAAEKAAPLAEKAEQAAAAADSAVGSVLTTALDFITGSTEASQAAESVKDAAEMLKLPSIRAGVVKSLGPAWWTLAIGFVIMIAAAVYGLVVSVKGSHSANAAEADFTGSPYPDSGADLRSFQRGGTPSVTICFGEMNGAQIPLENGFQLLIGRDPASCQMILNDQGIDYVQCRIAFDAAAGKFLVYNLSQTGTWYPGGKIEGNMPAVLSPGSEIWLGRRENVVQLNML